jgi:Tol biopolymer transport system component
MRWRFAMGTRFLGIAAGLLLLAAGLGLGTGLGLVPAGRAGRVERASVAERAGVIAFEAKDGLYTVDANGGEPRLVPGTKPGDGDPRWSPDGTTLAFDRERDGNRDIYVMNADGSGQRRLTTCPAKDAWPQWAPNGRSLAFLSERDGSRGVYAINVQTGAARRVTRYGQFPDWTPDGLIIFTGLLERNEAGRIFTIRAYGADRRPLPTQPGNALGVRVSDDGQEIVYSTRGIHQVYKADIDGGRPAPLVASENNEANDPAWSPDGEWVVYDFGPLGTAPGTAEGKYPSDVYVIRADGTENTRLTILGACCPDWRAAQPEP